MQLKFLQLNMYMGKKIDVLLAYIEEEQFDILSLQEVSGGDVSFGGVNCFQKISGLGYDGELLITWRIPQMKHSFFGQTIFFKKDFTFLTREEIWLNPYRDIAHHKDRDSKNDPKAVLGVTLEKEGKKCQVFTAHLAWTPDAHDSEEKLRQGKIVFEYMKNVKGPFIFSGDFNVDKNSQIVRWMNTLGRNLTVENEVINTLNPKIHKAPHLFPPGLAVDYIFTSPEIKVKKFKVVDSPDLSDHLGLYMKCEV